jgi:hypothetical protein
VIAFSLLATGARQGAVSARGLSTQGQLAQIESTVRSIRKLTQTHTVKTVFQNNAQFNHAYALEVRKGTTDSEIALAQRELVEIGWLTKAQNYKKIAFGTSANTYAGFYDPYSSTLYVRSNNNSAFGIRRDLIAHEYTHALQDQHYNLRKLMPDLSKQTYRNSDAEAAVHSLTEGDAVTSQLLFVLKSYSQAEYKRWYTIQTGKVPGPKLPKAIERDSYFPYNEGFNFAWKLYKMGGMAKLDASYGNLPNSTYVIMFPNAYLSGWKPVPVTLHRVLGMTGWKQVDDDVEGAWDYELMLWQTLPQKTATAVVRGYRGDRYVFLENGKQNAMLLRSVWKDHTAAVAARDALEAALIKRYSVTSTASHTATGETVKTPDGAVAFATAGSRISVTYGPSVAVAEQLLNAKTD